MKISELMEAKAPQTAAEAIKAAFAEALSPRGARLDQIYDLSDNDVAFMVEYDFPEHKVKGSDIKNAGKPHISKVAVLKSDLWGEGVFAVQYELTLKASLDDEEAKSLKSMLDKKYKVRL